MSSDSDSTSDSDISQGWTLVGPEGAVDSSSDHDSDIVVLRDDDDDIVHTQNSNEVDSAESNTEIKRNESQSERVHNPESETDFQQTTSGASEVDEKGDPMDENSDPSAGLELDEKTNVLPSSETESSRMNPDGEASVSLEENLEAVSSNTEPLLRDLDAENCVELIAEENGERLKSECEVSSLSETAKEHQDAVAETENHWELTDSGELSPNLVETCCLPSSSSLPTGFMASVFKGEKINASDDMCSNSLSKGVLINDGALDTDDDNEEEDDDDNDDDDDESVVRKFHEATLHASFNHHASHRDDRNENHEEDDFLPPDADDRCESDISGVADDSDSDLSSLAGIDDLQFNAGDVVRTYRHQPNLKFNKCLTLIAATAMLFAIGIGIGHYIGSTRESAVHQRQLLHLKMLQDEYFVCLRDVEKLESKLISAKNSGVQEKLTAVTAVWKKKYEELVLERAELEYRLNQMQDRVKALLSTTENRAQNIRENEKNDGQERSNSPTEQRHAIREPYRDSNESMLDNETISHADPEKLEQEAENRSSVADTVVDRSIGGHENISKVKTSVSSEENVTKCLKQIEDLKTVLEKRKFEIGLLRNDANQLAVENSDLKAALQNQRYKEHPGNLRDVLTKEKIEYSQQAVQYPSSATSLFGYPSQYLKANSNDQHHTQELTPNEEQNEKKSEGIKLKPNPSISLTKFFTDQLLVSTSDPTSLNYSSANNLSSCLAALKNITARDNSLFHFINGQIKDKEEIIRSTELLNNELKKILSLCQNSANPENSVNEEVKFSLGLQENETLEYDTKHLQKLMKQLKNAVQNVIRSVNHFPKIVAATANRQQIKNEIKNWSHKMRSGWKKFEEAVLLIKNQKQHKGHTKREPWQTSKVREPEDRGSVLRSVGEKSNRAFDGNRDHKQTESSSSHQRYEEFWRWNHFDPDDFLQEGFFEDNQREWHKHQKRLRKISGRIQRLNEEMLLSMDDDDIEDIYEDIDDFADDVEDREIPEQLRTWLSCQTRWWRSRVHRKHRNEDLVKGCGQQLMHWQLRVLCKEKTGKQNWGPPVGSRYHKFCKAVISSQGQGLDDRYFVLDKNLFQKGAKNFKREFSPPKMDDAKRCAVVGDHLDSLSCTYDVENTTYTDQSACSRDSWHLISNHCQSDFPSNPTHFAYGQKFPQPIYDAVSYHIRTGHKNRNDQMLHCHGDGKLSKFMQNDKQWCEK